MENQTEIMQPEIKKGFLKRAEEIKNSIEKKMDNIQIFQKSYNDFTSDFSQKLFQYASEDSFRDLAAMMKCCEINDDDEIYKMFSNEAKEKLKSFIKESDFQNDYNRIYKIVGRYDLRDTIGDVERDIYDLTNKDAEFLLEGIKNDNPLMEYILQKERITIENFIPCITDRDVQKILREVDEEILAAALLDTTEEVKEKIFKNISKTAAKILQKKIDSLGSSSESYVEKNKRKLISIISRLEDCGEILIPFSNDELCYS